jgi:hypothetical protein
MKSRQRFVFVGGFRHYCGTIAAQAAQATQACGESWAARLD